MSVYLKKSFICLLYIYNNSIRCNIKLKERFRIKEQDVIFEELLAFWVK